MKPFGKFIGLASALLLSLAVCWAQEDSSSGQSSEPAPAATVPDTATPDASGQTVEGPPLASLDAPSFEPGFGARSYLLFRAQASDAVDTNPASNLGSDTVVKNVVRGLGSVTLQKLWKVHPLSLEYVGGVDWFSGSRPAGANSVLQNHSLVAEQRFLWRTGLLTIRDSFSYLPQGSFGFSSFGGVGGLSGGLGGSSGGVISGGGIAGGVAGGVFGNGQFGSIGNQPRIANMSIVDITQSLSARTSIVLAGGYGLTHFVNDPTGYINSNSVIGQAGYNYRLSRKDQISIAYAYQQFHFPRIGAGSFNTNVFQVFYGHRISGKLDVSLGGGPQLVRTYNTVTGDRRYVSGAGRVRLAYHVSSRTNMSFLYSRYETPGSGFFAGATTDATRLSLNHALTRRWDFMTDGGYSHSSRVISVPTPTANNAGSYDFWYAGGGLHYRITPHFSGFTTYQFDNFRFAADFCATGTSCNRSYMRHVGVVGINWTPGPIRLD